MVRYDMEFQYSNFDIYSQYPLFAKFLGKGDRLEWSYLFSTICIYNISNGKR